MVLIEKNWWHTQGYTMPKILQTWKNAMTQNVEFFEITKINVWAIYYQYNRVWRIKMGL
jgi:hypothetical protein